MIAHARANKARNGYPQNSALADYGKATVVSALIMWYCDKLSKYKGISVMLVWVLVICLIYYFITSKTSFGRYFYAVGGNEKATRLSGINTNKVYFMAYANMGLLAGLCGLLCLAVFHRRGICLWWSRDCRRSRYRRTTARRSQYGNVHYRNNGFLAVRRKRWRAYRCCHL